METIDIVGRLKKMWTITAYDCDREGNVEEEWFRAGTRQGAIDGIIPKLWKYGRYGMKYADFILGQVWVLDIILPDGYKLKLNHEDELAMREEDIALGHRDKYGNLISDDQKSLIAELEASSAWKEEVVKGDRELEEKELMAKQEQEKKEREQLQKLKDKYES
jgi:hypothetical protein